MANDTVEVIDPFKNNETNVEVIGTEGDLGINESPVAPETPVTSPQTIAPAETPTAPSEPQVFDSNALLGNVQATYDKYGGAAGANEQFIQGVAKLATGRDATPEDLAKGGTISDIINRYNIGEKITGFGITPQATIEQPGGTPSDVSSPTGAGATPTETVATSPVISTIDEMIATKTAGLGEGVDLNYYQQVKTQTATDLENARQDIARQDILDQESLDALEGQGRGIPLGIIQAQQADLSEEQQLDRFKAVQNYNNLSILSKLAAGNFLEAQRINQNVASDMYQIEQLKIEKAKQQGLINEAEQLRLDAENHFKRSLALQGYVKVTDPSKLSGLTEDKIWRDPTNKDIYIKPVEEVPQIQDEYQFISGTEYQPAGVLNKTTGLFQTLGGDGAGAGIVATTTGDMYDIGSYATDPNHEASIQSILGGIGQFNTIEDIDRYINRVAPTSEITGQMIANAASEHGVSWEMITAIMQQDSSLGTKGLGATNNNPGNIGQFDSLGDKAVAGYKTLQDGVNAVAKNLAWRKVEQPTISGEVQGYVQAVKDGKLTDLQALQQVSNKNKQELVQQLAKTVSRADTINDIIAKDKINTSNLLKTHKGLNSAVGSSPFTRGNKLNWWDKLSGETQDFIGKVNKLVDGLSLESLIEAKSRGATFGALSNEELQMLANAATSIGSWVLKDKNGKVVGYDTTEKKFKEELDNINSTLSRGLKGNIQSENLNTETDPLGILNIANSTNPLGL